MIPYGSFYFFYILALALLPAVFLGLRGQSIKKYGMGLNILFLFLLFGGSQVQSICLALFYVGELILVKGYVYIRKKVESRWLLRGMILLSILPLIIVKSSHLFLHKTIGFLGVSYLTFKSVQMLIEIYDGLIKEVNLWEYTYFLLFFPTISSGPIDRSRRFATDLHSIPSKEEYLLSLKTGIYKISCGVAYKFIFGVLIADHWMNKIVLDYSFMHTVNYMYAYSLYLFFDFAGYSLLAVGVSYILGIKTPDNFNMPFLSKDIKDFWNRWHMSLSFWFRDFIYTRFVMIAMKKKWFKSRYTSSYIGYILTMGTMGIWHGSEIYYIIYGLYHAILIIGTDFFQRKNKWYKKVKNNERWGYVFIFVNFQLVCFGFLIFSGILFKK